MRSMGRFFMITAGVLMVNGCADLVHYVPEEKGSCDFGICEPGRLSIDTITDVFGFLKTDNGRYHIEVSGNAPEPDSLFIACAAQGIELPDSDSYVKFSGEIKDPCSLEDDNAADSLYLKKLEVFLPASQVDCQPILLNDGYDIRQGDDKLSILHTKMDGDCLEILITYTGSCGRIPPLSLHDSGDIGFGGPVTVFVCLQGEISNECLERNYALLKFDLSPLADRLGPDITLVTFYFISQGGYRINYHPQ